MNPWPSQYIMVFLLVNKYELSTSCTTATELKTENTCEHALLVTKIAAFLFSVSIFSIFNFCHLICRHLTLMCASWTGPSTLRTTASAPRSMSWTKTCLTFLLPGSTWESKSTSLQKYRIQVCVSPPVIILFLEEFHCDN